MAQRCARGSAAPNGPPRAMSAPLTLVGGVIGLLLAAAFWMVLGLYEPNSPGAGLAPAGEPHCTALALDRTQARTVAEPCVGDLLSLQSANASGVAGGVAERARS